MESEVFFLFVDNEFLERIREDTVRYTIEKEQGTNVSKTRRSWKCEIQDYVSRKNLLNHFAVLLAMGLLPHPDVRKGMHIYSDSIHITATSILIRDYLVP